jgi:hypothetical protein
MPTKIGLTILWTSIKSREAKIASAIDNWHNSVGYGLFDPVNVTIYEYLGWTWEEYARWVETNEPPPERYDIV